MQTLFMILSALIGMALGATLMLRALGYIIAILIDKEYPGIVYDEKKGTITFYSDMLESKKIKEFLKS